MHYCAAHTLTYAYVRQQLQFRQARRALGCANSLSRSPWASTSQHLCSSWKSLTMEALGWDVQQAAAPIPNPTAPAATAPAMK